MIGTAIESYTTNNQLVAYCMLNPLLCFMAISLLAGWIYGIIKYGFVPELNILLIAAVAVIAAGVIELRKASLSRQQNKPDNNKMPGQKFDVDDLQAS